MKSFCDPALVGDVGEDGVEQRQVGAGIDGQMKHVLLARLNLAGVDGHRSPRIDEDDAGGGVRLVRASAFFFLSSVAPRRFGIQWLRK